MVVRELDLCFIADRQVDVREEGETSRIHFERALIQERVKAGLRHARSKGKRLGRPTIVVDRSRIASLRAQGRGWKAIAREMKLGVGTVLRAAQQAGLPGSENP